MFIVPFWQTEFENFALPKIGNDQISALKSFAFPFRIKESSKAGLERVSFEGIPFNHLNLK